MGFRVIKGTFHVVGYSPDGDSVRFKADKEDSWDSLLGIPVKMNAKKHAQLRIEAIDTLETHFKREHQPLEFADLATSRLLEILGITDVVWTASHTRVRSANDGTEGFIMSRTTERNGRPVAFVFDGSAGFKDGQDIFLSKSIAKKSLNYKMVKEGLAYPTFYKGMFHDLRKAFSDEAVKARQARKGLWAKDKTNRFFQVQTLSDVTDTHVMLPKLFRRIVAYIKQNGHFDPHRFVSQLENRPESVLILSRSHFTHFDNLIKISSSGKIKLSDKPEHLVFMG